MKKLILPLIILTLVFGFLYWKKINPKPVDDTVSKYNNPSLGISFLYPKILTVKTSGDLITVHHEVPFVHHDFCDFKGEGTTTIPIMPDLHLDFYFVNKNMIDTMKQESPYIPQENFVSGEVVPSPGFIDSVEVGKLKGFKIFEGAEGCGQTTYYFNISNSKTLVMKQKLITVFTGAIDAENKDRAEAVVGVINREKETEILNSILQSLEIK